MDSDSLPEENTPDGLAAAEMAALERDVLWQRALALQRIAHSLTLVQAYDQARQMQVAAIAAARLGEESDNPQDSLDASSVLWEIAEDLALQGDWGAAREVAAAIKSGGKRQHALDALEHIAAGGTRSSFA